MCFPHVGYRSCGEGSAHSGANDDGSGSVVRIIDSGMKGFRRVRSYRSNRARPAGIPFGCAPPATTVRWFRVDAGPTIWRTPASSPASHGRDGARSFPGRPSPHTGTSPPSVATSASPSARHPRPRRAPGHVATRSPTPGRAARSRPTGAAPPATPAPASRSASPSAPPRPCPCKRQFRSVTKSQFTVQQLDSPNCRQ